MKKILITGTKGFIGSSIETWLSHGSNQYYVTRLDVRSDSWESMNFSEYDAVVHIAGIAHRKETIDTEELYYKVNYELTKKLAMKAKTDGVNHFIFFSSISIYGLNKGFIDMNTIPKPITSYGKSKLKAEMFLKEIEDKNFCVAILRVPMVYGPNCSGNYSLLSSFAKKFFLFPKTSNSRSMIYIDNLSNFTEILITGRKSGIFFPQNIEYINTSSLVKSIAKANGTFVLTIPMLEIPFKMISHPFFEKIFSDLIVDQNLSTYSFNYNVVNYEESITKTEILE